MRCAFKTLSPITAERSLVHRAIVRPCSDWHGCQLSEGLRGLRWGRGCLSDCLRTKHLLWPVIKALGNNRHHIHLDKHTFTLMCVCVCALVHVCMDKCALALTVVCAHKKMLENPLFEQKIELSWSFSWQLEKCLQSCSASGVPSGSCGCVGLGKWILARLTLRKNRLTDSDLDLEWKLSGNSTKRVERYSGPVGLYLFELREERNKRSFSAFGYFVSVSAAFHHAVVMAFQILAGNVESNQEMFCNV